MAWELWLGIVAVLLATAALVVAVLVWRHMRGARAHLTPPAAVGLDEHRDLVAFVANPSKPDVTAFEAVARAACHEAGLPDPLWLETTVEDPGVGQTRDAVARGADVVVAVGGDGTVRAVAEGLTGTGTPMALVPSGTGNLLARNLDIPVADHTAALRIVVAGRDRTIDVGWARITRYADAPGAAADDGATPGEAGLKHIFLVIAGLGFDAAMVADADDQLKAKVGWIAYFVAGVKHLHGKRMRTRIRVDDRPVVEARLRSLMVGNCGRLPGGINLIPDAVIDDGILDVAAIDTRGGLAGWAQLFGEVVMQGFGVRNDLPAKIGRIDHVRARRVTVEVEGGEQAQVDGDIIGRAAQLEAWVEPGALVVRTG